MHFLNINNIHKIVVIYHTFGNIESWEILFTKHVNWIQVFAGNLLRVGFKNGWKTWFCDKNGYSNYSEPLHTVFDGPSRMYHLLPNIVFEKHTIDLSNINYISITKWKTDNRIKWILNDQDNSKLRIEKVENRKRIIEILRSQRIDVANIPFE